MKLDGIHILLTYQCTFECDHCFVWGSPWQTGTLTLEQIRIILEQAKAAGVESIYFEGGEPFLYYALLVRGVEMAYEMGFSVGIVSNGYWAHTVEDALVWLQPLVGKLADLSVSCDLFHYSEAMLHQADNAVGRGTVRHPGGNHQRGAAGRDGCSQQSGSVGGWGGGDVSWAGYRKTGPACRKTALEYFHRLSA